MTSKEDFYDALDQLHTDWQDAWKDKALQQEIAGEIERLKNIISLHELFDYEFIENEA